MKGIKTPLCDNCKNKLYVINIRRKNIGLICPQCDYFIVKKPTKVLDKIVKKIKEDKKPTFKQRIYTMCGKCRKTKFVKCKKNTKRPFKGCGFGPTTYVCWCENPIHKKEPAWSQDRPRIWITNY